MNNQDKYRKAIDEIYASEDLKQRTIEKMKALGLFADLPESNQLSIMDFLK